MLFVYSFENPSDHICISLVLKVRARGTWTLLLTVISQFPVAVKLFVATVTLVLVVSWEMLVLYVVQRISPAGRNLSTELAPEFSLSCIPRYMLRVLVHVSHQL